MFEGFSQETGDFYWELCFHNERSWFQAHKEQFERCLNTPFRELANETFAIIEKEADPLQELELHVARIYRDARRLFGRGPYKENLWWSIHEKGRDERASFYFELSPRAWGYGLGYWCPKSEQMEEYRRRIAANPAAFERLAKDAAASGEFVLSGEEYKRQKGSFSPVIDPWYNRKWVSLSHEEDFGAGLFDARLPERLADAFLRLMPLYEFLNAKNCK